VKEGAILNRNNNKAELCSHTLLTVSEASVILRLSRSKVYLLIESRTLQAFKLGAEYRIKTSSVVNLL